MISRIASIYIKECWFVFTLLRLSYDTDICIAIVIKPICDDDASTHRPKHDVAQVISTCTDGQRLYEYQGKQTSTYGWPTSRNYRKRQNKCPTYKLCDLC